MHAPNTKSTTSAPRTVGEPFVWLTGAGLALGLLMVLGLLGMILYNGLTVFWPRPVAVVELRPEHPAEFMGGKILAGEIAKQQPRLVQDLAERERLEAEGRKPMEYQFYVGNKDAYGLGFLYLSDEAVAGITFPKEITIFERLEYGDAIGFPVALQVEGEPPLPATDPRFEQRLDELLQEVTQRREEVEEIEKRQIGRVNRDLQRLVLDEKRGEPGVPAKREVLQARYAELAERAGALRAEQLRDKLIYRLPTGAEREMTLGTLIGSYRPNDLSLLERIRHFFSNAWHFLVEEPREANTEGGVYPAIFGTAVMTLLMSVAVVPFGVLAAIYLREYAKQGLFVRMVRVAVNNLAGVPSIVFGVFGLGFFVYFLGGSIDSLFFSETLPTPTFGTGGILWASATLALMTVPVVIVATEEALVAVPRGMREGSLACGASKWQTIQRIVLPSSVPGILTGLILAMARGAGEVAPLMLVGVVKLAPSLPIDGEAPFFHPERKFMHLGFHIYDLGFQSPDSDAAKAMVFATTLLLILLVVTLNLGAILIRERLRRRYATGVF